MSRRASSRRKCIAGIFAILGAGLARSGFAQTPGEEPPPRSVIEQYLADRGLNRLLAAHLLERLKSTEGPERLLIADRLGSIYVGLLDAATTEIERSTWESQGQDLLRQVPEADSFNLRLNLAKARYLLAEDTAEKYRIRLVSPEDKQEAERALRAVNATFLDIAAKLNRRVEQLERQEASGRDEDGAALRAQLADSRRLRSLAHYYAGWSSYYVAFLSGRPQSIPEALVSFGWLLNASGGREPTLERLPSSLLRYEHVARAAIGVAMCEALRGRDTTAERWLEAIELADGVPDHIVRQLFVRRMVVLAGAGRWNDLQILVTRRRGQGESAKPLDVGEARLLAVLTLDALDRWSLPRGKELAQSLADAALTDLITLGEVRHVQDLVGKFGSAPLAGDGFIVQYIRGLQIYERARTAHQESGENPDEPSTRDAVINQYRAAATALDAALGAADVARFGEERSNGALLRGLATFYAGDLRLAADRFEQAFQTAGQRDPRRAEDALWMAIVALDKAVERGQTGLRERFVGLGSLYLQKFPQTQRAAKLLLRQSSSGMISEEKAVEILLAIEPGSPLHETARRQCANLLYTIYRRSRGSDRDFAALRFAEVAEEVIRLDRRRLAESSAKDGAEIVTQVMARVRQVLDAVLGMTAPDLERADKAIEAFDLIVASAGYDTSKIEDEITYRRFQIALFRGNAAEVTRQHDRLRAIKGPFSDRADRLMYNRALAAARAPDAPAQALRDVVTHGLRVMEQFGRTADALKDPAVFSLHNTVADAAATVYAQSRDSSMLEVATAIDRELLKLGDSPLKVLRRYAELGEIAGDKAGALDCWRTILAGAGTTAPEWFEARYHTIRLLIETDAARAREVMAQYKVLHPDFGPEPWGTKLKELDARLGSPSSPSGDVRSGGGGGGP